MKKWLFVLIALLLMLVSCTGPPVTIDQVKTVQAGDQLVISWTTSEPCKCLVMMCKDQLCSWSEPEPEYGTLHQYSMPAEYTDKISIDCIDGKGNRFNYSMFDNSCPAK